MARPVPDLTERRRLLQLETLYDLAVALHADRPEQELAEELLERVCAVLDPAAAVAVTRDPLGGPKAVARVGWGDAPPEGEDLLAEPVWGELLAAGGQLRHEDGTFCGRPFHELVATPLAYRGTFLGYLTLLDKERRKGGRAGFPVEDRRFLESVAALAGVALDSARRFEVLEAQRDRLQAENLALRGRASTEALEGAIVAQDPAMRRLFEIVERVAPRGVNVLIRGESGTGKELIARLLHALSRRSGPLVALNCAALPESLLESELFGIEEGVATGVEARRGQLELAAGGTLFLDEIGDLQPAVQVKLLRALQEREILRVGGDRPIPIDVRLVAATHRDLERLVGEGTFREDLYYRLKGVELELPPLRDRRQDIPLLVRHFAEQFAAREGLSVPHFDAASLRLLLAYDYPGNVRELQNLVEAAVSLTEGEVGADLLRSLLAGGGEAAEGAALDLESVEARHIQRVLRLTGGNKAEAARLLGIHRRTLARKGF